MTWLEFWKTFAGSIATVVASVTAGSIAAWFGVVQARIAKSQARTADAQKELAKAQLEIAFDKLKYDLFEKRYEVYLAAKGVIEAIFNQSPVNRADPELRRLRLKLDEARFFFPADTRSFCESIESKVYAVLVASQAASGYSEEHPERVKLRDQQANAEIALSTIYSELAQRFERDLSFHQLTKQP